MSLHLLVTCMIHDSIHTPSILLLTWPLYGACLHPNAATKTHELLTSNHYIYRIT